MKVKLLGEANLHDQFRKKISVIDPDLNISSSDAFMMAWRLVTIYPHLSQTPNTSAIKIRLFFRVNFDCEPTDRDIDTTLVREISCLVK